MKHYLESVNAVLAELSASPQGLSNEEAALRLAQGGKNKLQEGQQITLVQRFFQQLVDPMILILLAAALVSGAVAVVQQESFADVIIILFVVLLNAVLGVVQESKAEQAIAALREMSGSECRVLRDNHVERIKNEDLVVGDIVLLEAGDEAPADGRLIECASLKAEEAALTGESLPVDKQAGPLAAAEAGDVPLGDRSNMIYMGSSLVYGRGRAVITAIGMDTEMGKIAGAIAQAQEGKTPLQLKLSQLSRTLTRLVLGICVFIFILSLIRAEAITGQVALDTFMLAVSLAVAAIPEGLVAVVTIVLSLGVTKMSKKRAIIRRLTAVETLGCTQIICSDKTGTLTQNKMVVQEDYTQDRILLCQAMALCSDAEAGADGQIIGEPTEAALVEYAAENGVIKAELAQALPRVGEAPFDSQRKMMSTLHQGEAGIIQYTKGAPDELLKRCQWYVDGKGRVQLLEESQRQRILDKNAALGGQALRVLAAAIRPWSDPPPDNEPDTLEQDMVFIGLAGMMDPVRPEVLIAIQQCQSAGVRPVMITGDHKDTAAAIGRELGILTEDSQAITGAELDAISDEELAATIGDYAVFARVQPEHKVRIVSAWQAQGAITAMTGDGVNDAPAIKTADIGVGMGITGTDVTKNVADMVLADDNFATIVAAVEEGRRIYDNIRKTIQFLLSSNLSETLAILIATLLGFTILRPAHILWINLITDCFPALALGLEKGEADLMRRQPRPVGEGVFAGGLGICLVYQSLIVGLLTLAAYFLGHFMESGLWEIAESPDGMTMAFLTLSMAEIFHSFNLRSMYGSLFHIREQNIFLYGSLALSMLLTASVIYIPPLAAAFGFSHISFAEYAVALGLSILVIPLVEAVKYFQRKYRRTA